MAAGLTEALTASGGLTVTVTVCAVVVQPLASVTLTVYVVVVVGQTLGPAGVQVVM